MQRRQFLAATAATCTLAVVGQQAHGGSILTIEEHGEYASVSGDAERLVRVVDCYQDHLWPDWREHPPTVRAIERAKVHARKHNPVCFFTGSRGTLAAFRAVVA